MHSRLFAAFLYLTAPLLYFGDAFVEKNINALLAWPNTFFFAMFFGMTVLIAVNRTLTFVAPALNDFVMKGAVRSIERRKGHAFNREISVNASHDFETFRRKNKR